MTSTSLKDPEQLNTLLDLLENETRQLESAREQLNAKQQILVSGKHQQLAAVDRTLMAISKKAQELAKERVELTQRMGCSQQTLKALIPQMPAHYIPRFTSARDHLQRAALDVERLNRENRDLLTLSLQWVQDTVTVIAAALNPESASYTAAGTRKTKQGPTDDQMPVQSTVIRSA